MIQNTPRLMKKLIYMSEKLKKLQTASTQRAPYQDRLVITRQKEEILNAERKKKWPITYKGTSVQLTTAFSWVPEPVG